MITSFLVGVELASVGMHIYLETPVIFTSNLILNIPLTTVNVKNISADSVPRNDQSALFIHVGNGENKPQNRPKKPEKVSILFSRGELSWSRASKAQNIGRLGI